MEDKKDTRNSFIELDNKKFKENDVFIKFSYKGINKEKEKTTPSKE